MTTSQASEPSLFSALFDFSFTDFVTNRIIKVLYILALVGLTIFSLIFLVTGLGRGGGSALVALIVAPLYFLFGLIYIRVLLEVIIVLFRIGENTAVMAEAMQRSGGLSTPNPAAPPPPPPYGPTTGTDPQPPA
ncbi:hypothetical protein BH20ACT7_BH20ACT7_16910 [soil metagenome]